MSVNRTNQPLALEIRNVRKVFNTDIRKGKQLVLDDLSMRLVKSKCTGLLGHNGAGKTTAIRLILGLIRPDIGSVLFDGRTMETADRRMLGYMPEINKLPANLTAGEILKFHVELMSPIGWDSAKKKAAIDAALEQVKLSDHKNKRIKQMSKGMARRVAWAQATIHLPSVLILDEPMSGLDPVGRRAMRDWIQDIRKSGTTILLCTHELATVQALCDEVYILRKGKVVFSTLDPSANSGTPISKMNQSAATWPKFALHISGTNLEGVATLQKTKALSSPLKLNQEGFLVKMGFTEYSDALKWLNAATSSGMVVVRFGDASPIDEEELLSHFSQELNP